MTDQEINEAVAKKLGIDPFSFERDANRDYCHSIEAAWEILKTAIEYECQLTYHHWADGTDFWEASINEQKAEADTAPMAICKAFLKLP